MSLRRSVVLAVVALVTSAVPAEADRTKTCYDRGYEDLKAKNIRCDTAARVYERSKQVAQRNPDAAVTRFRSSGLRWSCRARNPPQVAFYTYRCTARGGRLMQYRWKSGD